MPEQDGRLSASGRRQFFKLASKVAVGAAGAIGMAARGEKPASADGGGVWCIADGAPIRYGTASGSAVWSMEVVTISMQCRAT